LQSDLAARADLEACAHIALSLANDHSLIVAVTLPDGRSAARHVAGRENVAAVLQALLLRPSSVEPDATTGAPDPLPLAAATAAPAAVSRPSRAPRVVSPTERERERDASPRQATAPRTLGFELSLASSARIGDGQFAVGLGALSFLELQRWLVGFHGRLDRYQSLASSDPELGLELGLLGGRRFDLGSVALDVNVGPAIAVKGFAFSQTQQAPVNPPYPPPPRPEPDPSTGPVPRLLFGARLGFAPRSVLRSFVGLDAELGPSRADDNVQSGAARLPTFTAGLVLGATVGTP
jgi:hypothetical protein